MIPSPHTAALPLLVGTARTAGLLHSEPELAEFLSRAVYIEPGEALTPEELADRALRLLTRNRDARSQAALPAQSAPWQPDDVPADVWGSWLSQLDKALDWRHRGTPLELLPDAELREAMALALHLALPQRSLGNNERWLRRQHIRHGNSTLPSIAEDRFAEWSGQARDKRTPLAYLRGCIRNLREEVEARIRVEAEHQRRRHVELHSPDFQARLCESLAELGAKHRKALPAELLLIAAEHSTGILLADGDDRDGACHQGLIHLRKHHGVTFRKTGPEVYDAANKTELEEANAQSHLPAGMSPRSWASSYAALVRELYEAWLTIEPQAVRSALQVAFEEALAQKRASLAAAPEPTVEQLRAAMLRQHSRRKSGLPTEEEALDWREEAAAWKSALAALLEEHQDDPGSQIERTPWDLAGPLSAAAEEVSA